MKDFATSAFESAAISVSSKVTVGGGAVAAGSGVVGKTVQVVAENPQVVEQTIRITEVGAVVGMTVAILGFVTNLYFGLERRRREREAHEWLRKQNGGGNGV